MNWKSLAIEIQEGGERFVVARPSLVVGLIGGQELLSSAVRILDFWSLLRQADRPVFALGSNSRVFRALSVKTFEKLRNSLTQPESIEFLMLKDAPGFDVGSCSLQFSFDYDAASGEQASVAMAFPPETGESPNCDVTADRLLSLFHEVRPQQAFASFGFSMVFGREYEAAALPKLFASGKRFAGLDLPERFTEVRLGNRLKSTYWITGVATELLRAHGVEADSQQIRDAGIAVRQADGFVTYRTDPCPPVGDLNRQAPDLSRVRALHRALRPALLEKWASSNVFGLGVDDIDDWFDRFGS